MPIHNQMSKIDEYIARRSQQSADFTREYKEVSQQLHVAVEIHNLQDKRRINQWDHLTKMCNQEREY